MRASWAQPGISAEVPGCDITPEITVTRTGITAGPIGRYASLLPRAVTARQPEPKRKQHGRGAGVAVICARTTPLGSAV